MNSKCYLYETGFLKSVSLLFYMFLHQAIEGRAY